MKIHPLFSSHQNPPTYLFRNAFAHKPPPPPPLYKCIIHSFIHSFTYLIWTYFTPNSDETMQHFKVRNILMMDLFLTHSFLLHKMLIDGLESCELIMDYCDVLSTDLWSLSTSQMVWGWINVQLISIFGWTIYSLSSFTENREDRGTAQAFKEAVCTYNKQHIIICWCGH